MATAAGRKARPTAVSENDLARNQRLLTLVGCVRGIVLEFDGHARYVNAWADDPALLAGPAQTMIGKTICEVLGDEAGAPATVIVLRVHATGQIEHLEYPITLDAHTRWFLADIKRVGTAATGMTVVFFARDITDRKVAEEALSRSEERYRLAEQATTGVLWDLDLATGRIAWGATARTVLGYVDIDDRLSWWEQQIHPDDLQRLAPGFEAALAGDELTWSDSYRFRRGDGSYGEFFDRAFIVRDAAGRAVRMVGSLTDVTQINRLRSQLIQADRLAALGLLAAGVGHEINNPLTYVISNLEVALETLGNDDGELGEILAEARDGARRIADIVKTLKMFSRHDEAVLGPVDLHAVLERAIRMADNEIRHRARLVRQFGPIPFVHAREGQLAQVCLNLIVNAAQAIVERSTHQQEIRISTRVDDQGCVEVVFADTGVGISPEHLDRVFDPFFTTKDIGSGTGLGLAICHGILEQLGGTIRIDSELGRGTTVTVLLPAV